MINKCISFELVAVIALKSAANIVLKGVSMETVTSRVKSSSSSRNVSSESACVEPYRRDSAEALKISELSMQTLHSRKWESELRGKGETPTKNTCTHLHRVHTWPKFFLPPITPTCMIHDTCWMDFGMRFLYEGKKKIGLHTEREIWEKTHMTLMQQHITILVKYKSNKYNGRILYTTEQVPTHSLKRRPAFF